MSLFIPSSYKHQAFKEEAEYRIVIFPNTKKNIQVMDEEEIQEKICKSDFKEIYTRGDNNEIPYIKLFEGLDLLIWSNKRGH